MRLLKKLFRSIFKKNSRFTNELKEYCKYEIGNYTYGTPRIYDWNEGAKLTIGKYCSIAEGVCIFLGGNHRTDWVSMYPFPDFFPEASHITGHPQTKGDVIIGSDVWIGNGAVIMSGVKIGSGAVIGARSLVTKNVEPFSIVAGNPAKHIKYRFDDTTINKLLKISWWNWPESKILGKIDLLLSNNIDKFIDHSE